MHVNNNKILKHSLTVSATKLSLMVHFELECLVKIMGW